MAALNISQYPILVTDKKNQLGLLSHNITLNGVSESCFPLELCWESEQHFQLIQQRMRSIWTDERVDFLLASDVLYDSEAAKAFFSLSRRLATAGVTKLLLAQKLRDVKQRVSVAELAAQWGCAASQLCEREAVALWLVDF
jgi:predicted nicotinamide N-methyase